MATVKGIVREGRIVPSVPLPEGSPVEIHLCDLPDLREELAASQFDRAKAADRGRSQVPPARSFASAQTFREPKPLSPSPRCFPTWEEYERFLREENEALEP
jgi:hypothetical protein